MQGACAVSDDLVIKGEFDASAIASRRTPPRVYVVDAHGELVAWSARSSGALQDEVKSVVLRFIREPDHQPDTVELIRAGDEHVTVRILPQHDGPVRTFAVIVERFALRDDSTRRT